jgi:hypothetical protein
VSPNLLPIGRPVNAVRTEIVVPGCQYFSAR